MAGLLVLKSVKDARSPAELASNSARSVDASCRRKQLGSLAKGCLLASSDNPCANGLDIPPQTLGTRPFRTTLPALRSFHGFIVAVSPE